MKEFRYLYRAVIVKVYDGDTVTADIDLGLGVWSRGQKLRLLDVDTPELRGEDRAAGLRARDELRSKVLHKEVVIETRRDKTGKYGRWLATIWLEDENINQWLLDSGLAEKY